MVNIFYDFYIYTFRYLIINELYLHIHLINTNYIKENLKFFTVIF